MNRSYKPDLVVQCGDMIEDIDRIHDEKNFAEGVRILSKLKRPVYHVIGNHDQRNLSDQQLKATLNCPQLYYSVDHDDYRLLFLYTRQSFEKDGGLDEPFLDSEQLIWLKQRVVTDKKIILFSHAALFPVDTDDNFWFKGASEEAYIKNHNSLFEILKDKKILFAVNGHLHCNKLNQFKGITSVTVQSLVENISGRIRGAPANSYALIDINESRVRIDIKGRGGVTYKLPLK